MRDRETDARTRRGDLRRAQVIAAVLACADAGDFRPTYSELAFRTGIPIASIASLFGRLHLLYRVVARERAAEICEALRRHSSAAERDMAWIVMVGKKRELP